MDGWTAVERTITPTRPLDEATEALARNGFEVHVRNKHHVVLKRPGTTWTMSARRFPLDLSLATTRDGDGLHLRLRYDAFVAADSGDLERLTDELIADLYA